MSPDIAVIFSLPSVLQGQETDARSLCTVQLARTLVATHNDLMAALKVAQHNRVTAEPSPTARDQTLSYLTPPEEAREALLNYNFEKDFVALISATCSRKADLSEVEIRLQYDLPTMETALQQALLRNKGVINLDLRQYRFAGEVKASGHLAKLRLRIAQVQLPPSTQTVIASQLDVSSRVQRLLVVVEDCVSFLATAGGASHKLEGISATMLLKEYATKFLRIPAREWVEISSEAIDSSVGVGFVEIDSHRILCLS
jgi:hypothetical protein